VSVASIELQVSQPPIDVTRFLKVKQAIFVIGYPKGNLPRIEADILSLLYYNVANQFEIVIKNPREVTE
jgi:hypothetical protein